MANLVALNMKRKDLEVSNHEFSIFRQTKRIKSQAVDLPEMMEEEKSLVNEAINVPNMASWLPPQGQEADHDMEDNACGAKSSAHPVRAEEAAASPMEIEQDVGQYQQQMQPSQSAPIWSGFF